jgi:hypothetical protein
MWMKGGENPALTERNKIKPNVAPTRRVVSPLIESDTSRRLHSKMTSGRFTPPLTKGILEAEDIVAAMVPS